MSSFTIIEYSKNSLEALFSNKTKTPLHLLKKKLHILYFGQYFEKLCAQSIIVEEEYVDKDYLEDYSSYYVKSFKPYNRFCSRLHFFTSQFTNDEFRAILNRKSSKFDSNSLQSSYLGFIVLKPLPKTFIGRTCLKTYPYENNRYFPFIRIYNVNLFGINLTVSSIAYQEQDSIVSACASSAIWTAFQSTGVLFQHSIPSPVEITKNALKYFPYANRHFPNKGLTAEQMAHAIRNVGLEPFLINASNYDNVKATVYAYHKAKIPLVLGMNLIDCSTKGIVLGKHAVTITGYNLGSNLKKFNGQDFLLTSSKIEKIYAHDDQIGPFARMELNRNDNCFSTSWADDNGIIGNVKGQPEILIIPLYHKIRIPFEVILLMIYHLDDVIKTINNHINIGVSNIEWDIFLSNNNDFKVEIFNSDILDEKQKIEILESNFPKYIWRAVAIWGTEKIELIFDSTDIEQGDIFMRLISYSCDLSRLLKTIAENINLDVIDILKSNQLRKIFEEIKK